MILELILIVGAVAFGVWFLPQLGFTMVHTAFFVAVLAFAIIGYMVVKK